MIYPMLFQPIAYQLSAIFSHRPYDYCVLNDINHHRNLKPISSFLKSVFF